MIGLNRVVIINHVLRHKERRLDRSIEKAVSNAQQNKAHTIYARKAKHGGKLCDEPERLSASLGVPECLKLDQLVVNSIPSALTNSFILSAPGTTLKIPR